MFDEGVIFVFGLMAFLSGAGRIALIGDTTAYVVAVGGLALVVWCAFTFGSSEEEKED